MPHLQAIVTYLRPCDCIDFQVYCLPWRIPQADGLIKKLKDRLKLCSNSAINLCPTCRIDYLFSIFARKRSTTTCE